MKVLIAAGGSGGHLIPAQQLASSLSDCEVLFAGHKLDTSPFFQRERFSFFSIRSAPLQWSIKGLFQFIKESMVGCYQSLKMLRRFRPDVVVGFGSFHSFPVLLAAFILRKKLVLFEANCLLGKVNRLFAPFSQIVAAQFDLKNAPKHLRSVPLLPWTERNNDLDHNQAVKELGFDPSHLVCLVFGGSQGAAFLNRSIPSALPRDIQVIHLTGSDKTAQEVAEQYRAAGIKAIVKGFETNMAKVYAAADFAICRSGAATMAELIHYALPALLIPFPKSMEDHQRINAQFLAKKIGGAKMLDESFAETESLAQRIGQLIQERDDLKKKLIQFHTECVGRVSLKMQIQQLGGE